MQYIARAAAIAAAAILTSTAMHADTIHSYGMHIGSQHYPSRDFNNLNPGGYVRWDGGLTIGGYYNSERRMSAYAGYTTSWGPATITVGAITGYRRAVLPFVIPSLTIAQAGNVSARLAVLPKVERSGSTVVHLMLEFKQ